MVTPAHCRNYFKKSPFFLPGAASEYLTRTLYTPSAPDLPPFPARNRLGAPSAPELGCFPARQAVGNPFRAGFASFSCPEPPRSTFCAGFGAFFCPGGGRYSLPRRICLLFLSGTASEHLPRRIWTVFLRGRRVNPKKYLCSTKKRLPRMRKTLKCGRIYKPSSVLQTGARRHPKKLLSFICCSLPPSNGRATLDCWYTWPCRLQ